ESIDRTVWTWSKKSALTLPFREESLASHPTCREHPFRSPATVKRIMSNVKEKLEYGNSLINDKPKHQVGQTSSGGIEANVSVTSLMMKLMSTCNHDRGATEHAMNILAPSWVSTN